MDPNDAIYPKSRLSDLEVLYNDEAFSIAHIKWDGKDRIAIRWNHTENSDLGFPLSRGRGSWFVMPNEIILSYAKEYNLVQITSLIYKINKDKGENGNDEKK